MPLSFQYGDITRIEADAIVNAANESLLGGGGVDGAIHNAAGPELLEECRTLNGCKTGEAKMTAGYKLPAKHVIHTVGPVWRGGDYNEENLLRSCYRNCLKIALENGFETIAFPLISAGVYSYPKEDAFYVACDEISKVIAGEDIEVILVLFAKPKFAKSIDEYTVSELPKLNSIPAMPSFLAAPMSAMPLAEERAECSADKKAPPSKRNRLLSPKRKEKLNAEKADTGRRMAFEADECREDSDFGMSDSGIFAMPVCASEAAGDFDFSMVDESFSDLLFKLIDRKGLSDPECYKRANISRKLFSKIRCDKEYRPEKKTVLAFAVALELSMDDTEMLLKKAGFAFSDCNKFDIIVSYYITRGIYNIFEINEALFEHDQLLLGSSVR